MKNLFLQSLIWRTLLPVILIGSCISLSLTYFLIPPLTSIIAQRADKELTHTTFLAINVCEERLSDILDLRMEENLAMNDSSKKEALQEIKEVASIFPNIKIMVVDNTGSIQGASFPLHTFHPQDLLDVLQQIEVSGSQVIEFLGETLRFSHEYFPFWRWHIISFIPEKEYLAPINMTKSIVTAGTFGTLFAVVVSVVFLFLLQINRPLRKIIEATEQVREGSFQKVGLTGHGEIERVAVAFDEMVTKLDADKKKIELILKELGESEEQYRILFENSLALVIMLRDDKFLYANTAAQAFFNRSLEDLLAKDIYTFLDTDETVLFRQKIKVLDGEETKAERFEISFHLDTPEERWLEVLASVIPFQGKKSIIIHAIEITRRKLMKREQESMRQKLERSERMEVIGTLAGGVAHDLNNILGGIVGYPELLMQGMNESDRLYKPLQTIHNSGVRAAAIVQDLLTLTRRGVVVTEIVSLGEIINDYLDSPEFNNLCSHHPGTKMEKEIAGDLLNILGSKLHLSKTIMNLVSNAAEAMPDGGTIRLIAQNCYVDTPIGHYEEIIEGEYVLLTVTDSGQGIPQKDIARIFEPFYTKKVMGRSGTGLGMSVVWGTIKDHEGYIEVHSTPNVGTTFNLYFPVTRKAIEKPESPFSLTDYMGQDEKILVIDDVKEQRVIASSMLEQLGYSVQSVDCGEKAVKLLQTTSFDLLIIDMIMDPKMDGLETYREVLRLSPGQKAVMASGFSETERVREALSLGAGAYIKKPYGLETLAKAIKKELEKPTAQSKDAQN